MPREEIVEHHLEMMAFEQQILATPRFVSPRVGRRSPSPRRTAFVIACVCTTIASCGLSAAGALPEPLQHITDSIAHTLGVPHADHVARAAGAFRRRRHHAAASATAPAAPRRGGSEAPATTAPAAVTHDRASPRTTAPDVTPAPGSGPKSRARRTDRHAATHAAASRIKPESTRTPPPSNEQRRTRRPDTRPTGALAVDRGRGRGSRRARRPSALSPGRLPADRDRGRRQRRRCSRCSWTFLNDPQPERPSIAKTESATPPAAHPPRRPP